MLDEFLTGDLDRVANGVDRLTWLEENTAHSDQLRRAMANVWVWGELPTELAERIEAAAMVRLPRPWE